MTRNPSSSITAFFSTMQEPHATTCYEDTKDHFSSRTTGAGHYFLHANSTLEDLLKLWFLRRKRKGLFCNIGFSFYESAHTDHNSHKRNCFSEQLRLKGSSNDLLEGVSVRPCHHHSLPHIPHSAGLKLPGKRTRNEMKFTMACPIAHTFLSIQIRACVKWKFEK